MEETNQIAFCLVQTLTQSSFKLGNFSNNRDIQLIEETNYLEFKKQQHENRSVCVIHEIRNQL